MKRAGGRKSAGADCLIIDNRRSELTFGNLGSYCINSGAIGQKTLSQRKVKGTVAVLRHKLDRHCMPCRHATLASQMEVKTLEEWLMYLPVCR